MLVDEINVTIKAGDGGRGIVSFGKLERSGPDGGNGGKGGDVYIEASSDLTLLGQFLAKPEVEAENGVPGGQDKMTGAYGEDLILKLPVGTILKDLDTEKEFELEKVGQRLLLCLGGAGGIGNFDLRSSRNTTPENTIKPKKGQVRRLFIKMRFLADFGLVGLPSSGKSSLLNELTNANVKTASYHFTTLSPNLGVLPGQPAQAGKKIIADIPGLIEGASDGRGLGVKFLKHIEKVGLLLHCIGADTVDPMYDYKIIRKELERYNKEMLEKREVIVITKSDLVTDGEIRKIKSKLKKAKREILVTSIHDLESMEKLRAFLAEN